MKILFILPEYYPHSGAGISTYYLNYIKALQPHCTQIKVMVGSGYTQSNDVLEHEGVSVEYLKPELYQQYLTKFTQYDLLPEFKRNIAAAWALWQQADEGKGFDIIECTDFSLGFIPWVIHHNKPVITRLHGSMGQISVYDHSLPNDIANAFIKQAELSLLPLCDELVSHSKANQSFWIHLLKTKNVVHINPVYNTGIKPLPLSQREDNGLVTARIQSWKGPVELCEAYKSITPLPLIKWIGRDMLYNDRVSTSSYLKTTYPAVWGKFIIPLAPLPNTEMQALQQKAKYGIIASTWDMFNFTAVEFMSVGTPVICSEGAGVSELIDHGKNGFKFTAGDSKTLADCLKEINTLTEEEYNAIANAAFETIKTELFADKLLPANLDLYKSAINNFKPGSSNLYFDKLYKPTDERYDIATVLDKQPLKKLTQYYIQRLKQKFLGKK